ncbi:MAG: RES family NAD+ phosphorylase [Saprospiraceae bacterium]|nr:RES family NAD+ phosphorylase [Saprospiraceae bacterium]
MLVYRIDRQKRRDQVLSGYGAFLTGGRWNRPGIYTVYTAVSRSLAILEMLVHLDLDRHLPDDRIIAVIEIPNEILPEIYTPSINDESWRLFPYPAFAQNLFSQFANERKSPMLSVPSAIVPQERNILLNPQHQDFNDIKVVDIEILDLDQRLIDY